MPDASPPIAISIQNLGKSYRRYHRPSDRLKELLLPSKVRSQEFWALQDVSFDIYKGETVGVIGRNGAGKSTLLQIICGTLRPTQGVVQVNGRVAALLELGAGFNPEFTGRENVYMNGAIMGLSREEIHQRFEAIAAFADIGNFLEQPVKTYSSGMYVRLAFAAAINVEPDILIVDEALAVGDIFFQAKCMAQMRRMIEQGTTILFVSHDTGAVKALCQRCAFFDQGRLSELGKAADVVSTYIRMMHGEMNQSLQQEVEEIAQTSTEQQRKINPWEDAALSDGEHAVERDPVPVFVTTSEEKPFSDGANRYGNGDARILDIQLLNSQNQPTHQLDFKEAFTIQVAIRFNKDLPSFCLGYSLRDLKGQMLIGTVTTAERLVLPAVREGEVLIAQIQGLNIFSQGVYTITLGVEFPVHVNQQHIFMDIVENAFVFQAQPAVDPLDRIPCMIYAPVQIQCFPAPMPVVM
jgi:ABC-type polysaccharide/polyol phosphate transport system ATPase subunit